MKDAPPGASSYGLAFFLVGYDCRKAAKIPDEQAMVAFIQDISVKR